MKHLNLRFCIIPVLAVIVFSFLIHVGGDFARASDRILRMATTTSTDNTGILDYLSQYLYRDTGIRLIWVAVGTGKALVLGKNCDVDVLFVHAPDAEEEFIKNGYGMDRKEVMYNDFLLAGPEGDPAGLKGLSVFDAFKKIYDEGIKFISRGDDSGTNKKEISIWRKVIGRIPGRTGWYIETGQGMLKTLIVAADMGGYTITDRGTFIKYKALKDVNTTLEIVVEGDEVLRNQYSVIAVNPERCKVVNYKLAEEFINWITSDIAQDLIANFRILGEKIFIPNSKNNK